MHDTHLQITHINVHAKTVWNSKKHIHLVSLDKVKCIIWVLPEGLCAQHHSTDFDSSHNLEPTAVVYKVLFLYFKL